MMERFIRAQPSRGQAEQGAEQGAKVALLSLGRDSVAGMVRGKSRGRLQECMIPSVLKRIQITTSDLQ